MIRSRALIEDMLDDHDYAADPQFRHASVLVPVDVAKLDASWQRDDGLYIPPGGRQNVIGDRYIRAKMFIQSGQQLESPMIGWNEWNGCVNFSNGRHRFAALRDLGVKRVMVSVPIEQEKFFKDNFA